jgi:hypothetical protein
MRVRTRYQSLLTALLLAVLGLGCTATWSTVAWAQQTYRMSDRQMEQLLTRIEARAAAFRNSFNDSLNSTRNNNVRRDEALEASRSFADVASQLTAQFRNRNLTTTEVQDLLDRAQRLDNVSRNLWLTSSAQNDWRLLRSDLTTLANTYGINYNWSVPSNVSYMPQRRANWLTGTWRLDPGRSDNIDDVAARESRGLPANEQDRVRNLLLRRLESPDTLALERRGRQVTIASTRAPQVTFDADGRTRTETNNNGRTVSVRATLTGDQLAVNTTGDRGNDYNVTFTPIDGGQRLRVTRSIYTERIARPVTVTSVYERSSDIAQFDLYRGPADDNRGANRGPDTNRDTARRRGSFYVPDGTQLVAVLNTNLDTRNVRNGDRFTMTVRTPRQYDGAVIEGVVVQAERSGRVTGRAELGLEFERIRLNNGQSYDFAGYLEGVRTPNGENVRIDTEGSVKEDDSQTSRTVTRSGIGAALGAIIGAIAGGGQGAAIGAAIGAGAGAGSVFIQGRDDLELPTGTEITLRASAPRNTEARR